MEGRVRLAVEHSLVDPIVQLRRHPDATADLVGRLVTLVKDATLDSSQLDSFLQALLSVRQVIST